MTATQGACGQTILIRDGNDLALAEERLHSPPLEDKAGNASYSFYAKGTADPKNLIFVEEGFSRPAIREISAVSAAVRGLQEGYKIHRICFPAELKDKIGKLYHRQ